MSLSDRYRSELTAIGPIDGRYNKRLSHLSKYFSEHALIKTRVEVEVLYHQALVWDRCLSRPNTQGVYENFDINDSILVKEIEEKIGHDVKAVEYYLRDKLPRPEYIHFGLTSQDINNTAIPLLLKRFIHNEFLSQLRDLEKCLDNFATRNMDVKMLAKTHGQSATPTTLGKEFMVFWYRLQRQTDKLDRTSFTAKFGGATGGLNAHYIAYPDDDWDMFVDDFIKSLGLTRERWTTQISNYDSLAELFQLIARINIILIDLCQDVWLYISNGYLKQENIGTVGSSTMPHKINPINFENAEGNLGWAQNQFEYLAKKLPVSRLQRDLTDSTVLRNVGLPFAHTVLAIKSIMTGMSKISANVEKINGDLENSWEVVTEAVQTILRREGFVDAYEQIKNISQGQRVSRESLENFIINLNVRDAVKAELLKITPMNY